MSQDTKKQQNNFNLLDDIIELNQLVKSGLETKKPKEIIDLYSCYKYLNTTIDLGYNFINGYFDMNINSSVLKETKSFLSPELKWISFTQEELKAFNDALLKYIDYVYYVFSHNKFQYFLYFHSMETKMEINQTCRELEYKYIKFAYIFKNSRYDNSIYTTKTIPIDSVRLRNKITNNMINNLEKLKEFKEYLDNYFLENVTVKDLLIAD
jgi:hypothetical protein